MAAGYMSRELLALGHEVERGPARLSPGVFGKAARTASETPHAVAEAVQRPSTRCVPIETDDQLDLQALHRVRSGLIE